MKKLILSLVLITTSLTSYCQANDSTPTVPRLQLTANKIVYTAIIKVDSSLSKELLFHNAQEWYKHNYETSDNTFIINDIDLGKISGTGIIHARKREKKTDPGDLFFTVDIIAVKGEYQYRVYSIYGFEGDDKIHYSDMYNEYVYPPSKPRWPKSYMTMMLNNMNNKVNTMIAKMEQDMTKPTLQK